jgi:hypothetical protein
MESNFPPDVLQLWLDTHQEQSFSITMLIFSLTALLQPHWCATYNMKTKDGQGCWSCNLAAPLSSSTSEHTLTDTHSEKLNAHTQPRKKMQLCHETSLVIRMATLCLLVPHGFLFSSVYSSYIYDEYMA